MISGGETTQEHGGSSGAKLVKDEKACSLCRHWDLAHVQRVGLDDEEVPVREYFARCMNQKSQCKGLRMEANETCEEFEPR